MKSTQSIFLPGPHGALYVSVFVPNGSVQRCGWVIHIPAFAEEMNKCRPMVSRQARQLVDLGFVVIVPDFSGTGDSEGHFSEANWECWKEDLKRIIDWSMSYSPENIILWGLRLGCLLAADISREYPDVIKTLLFWQPVHNGKQFMTQFLRLRMAASLIKGNSETVSQLRDRLLEGESLEVAGYELSPSMLSQVDSVSLPQVNLPQGICVRIFEVVSEEDNPLAPITQKQLDDWRSRGIDSTGITVPGDPFWMTQEIALAPRLLSETCSFLSSLPGTTAPLLKHLELDGVNQAGSADEKGIVFDCEGQQLLGILHQGKQPAEIGVLIVTGGPQYRIGSHRQFVYLARFLSSEGVPVFRFDYRGMGDSSGELSGFDSINADIRSAIDAFEDACEGIREVVIWGLCDAATAAVFYAPGDARVKGLVLANPWVYSAQGAARAYLKHYYIDRLFSKAFWRKVLKGQYKPVDSIKSFFSKAQKASLPLLDAKESDSSRITAAASSSLVERFTSGLGQFSGKVLLLLSGEDLTSAEFKDACMSNRKLRNRLANGNVQRVDLPGADHTFSASSDREKVERLTASWLQSLADD